MASIYIERYDGKVARRVHRGIAPAVATLVFLRTCEELKLEGFTVDKVSPHEALISRKGKPVSYTYIEFFSPPSAEEPGQPLRRKKA